jgi:hypothetical protein
MTVFFYEIFMRAQRQLKLRFLDLGRKKMVDVGEISTNPLLSDWAQCGPGLHGPVRLLAENPYK